MALSKFFKDDVICEENKITNLNLIKICMNLEKGVPPQFLKSEEIEVLEKEIGNDWFYFLGFDEKYHGPNPSMSRVN